MRPERLALSRPLDVPDVPVAEVVATTYRAEARTAMALVAALRDRAVPIRDLAVVVRDLDTYEEPLGRAAVQYGVAPVFWTQLRVTRTRPYALVESVCELLDTDEPDPETLFRPLEHRWAPPSASEADWPLDPAVLRTARRAVPSENRPVEAWCETFQATPEIDDRLAVFAEWVTERPDPTPETVVSVLDSVVAAYEEVGLPVTKANDSPALMETETDARAVVRVADLVEQVGEKYADRLEGETLDAAWSSVADLCGLLATQRPGRREHSNARALDVLEANDVWMLDIPYVVAVGLTDGEWPQETDSTVPSELQEAILTGDGEAANLAPRTAWTDGRDRDQFADTLSAARNGLVVTRHTESVDGDEKRPSPFLARLDLETVSDADRRRLVGSDRELPDAIRGMFSDEVRGGKAEDEGGSNETSDDRTEGDR
ncbi:PD-(D/E)XK nuclease family protein [Halorussus pelagicus]|uniref:hypothetical protein n=1 Tax=Halorussus pelagicus TaxID=2505977 RepID=UPI001AA0266E|nr:hypothetical protein [Halorussus pelagicus]